MSSRKSPEKSMNIPVIAYFAPTILPIFAAVCASTRPEAPRFCSSSKCWTCSRSTSRTAGLAASSEISIPGMPRCRPSKFSLSWPIEPPLSNMNTAMPGRVSCPLAWVPNPASRPPTAATASGITIERERIRCSSSSESQLHALLGAQHFGGPFGGANLVARSREQLVHRLVVVLGIVMEQDEARDLGVRREPHGLGVGRVPPPAMRLELHRRVHRVVDQQLHAAEELDELFAPRHRGGVLPT